LEGTLLGDLKSFQARFIALRQAIVLDGMTQSVPFSDKDLTTLSERIAKEGTSFVKVTLPIVGKALDSGLVTGQFICPANFRTKRNTRLPILCFAVFREIFDDEGVLLKNPNSTTIYFLRQFLLLDAKLVIESTPEQKEQAVQGFKARQEALRKVRIQRDHPVLHRAKWLLGRVLSNLDLSDITPGHGPGAVAEKIDRFERWDFLAWPAKAERHYPYLVYGSHSLEASLARGKGIPLLKTMDTRCCLVPKDFKGPRLISAEGVVNQYLQQGQMKAIMQYVDRHPILSRSIQLRDQTRNQKMAQHAVENGLITLDLSNASDTVSTTLVWYLLSEVPLLRRQLMSTRSDYMVYNTTDRTKIVAFAPMGSATCFPVETLVFWALSMASLMLVRSQAVHKAKQTSASWDQFLRELSSQMSVFGDDIIIPDDAFDVLVGTLTSVGCSVNASKTCYRTPFRESCGTEWMYDTDVTIIRNRRYHYEDSRKFKDYPVLLGLQRKFFLQGLYNTAELCENWAREIYPVVTLSFVDFRRKANEDRMVYGISGPPISFDRFDEHRTLAVALPHAEYYSGRNSGVFEGSRPSPYFTRQAFALDSYPACLGWQANIDAGMPIRYNRDYQRMEFRIPVEYHLVRNWTTEGYPRLLARVLGDSTDRIAIRDRKIKMAWSYLPYLSPLSRSRLG
jgi:hypothetical protein